MHAGEGAHDPQMPRSGRPSLGFREEVSIIFRVLHPGTRVIKCMRSCIHVLIELQE